MKKKDGKINQSIREKVNAWYVQNEQEYSQFKQDFDKMSINNLDFTLKIFNIIQDYLPKEIVNCYKWLFYPDTENIPKPKLLREYGDLFETCVNGDKFFTINLITGEVKSHSSNCSYSLTNEELEFSKQKSDSIFDNMPILIKNYIGGMFENNGADIEDIKNLLFFLMSVSILCIPKLINNLIHYRCDDCSYAYSICYFLIFDQGLLKIQKKLTEILSDITGDLAFSYQIIMNILTKSIVITSVKNNYNSKSEWINHTFALVEDFADIINTSLFKIKGTGGRKADFRPLQEMYIGDREEIIRLVDLFLEKETETVSLAYLFYVLRATNHISCHEYAPFHRSLKQAYPYRDIKGLNRPQERYLELKSCATTLLKDDFQKYEDYNKITWKKAHKIILEWLPLFKAVK